MQWESVNWLQKRFMKWFNKERTRSMLTFPVESVSLLDDGEKYIDQEWADFVAQMWSEGHSFFMYRSDNVDSLSSCCRLRNEITDNQFSYTLGAGGISTGSKCVMTININRIVQETFAKHPDWNKETFFNGEHQEWVIALNEAIAKQVSRIHCYLKAFNTILMDRFNAGLIPLYDAGFVNPDRQYLTVGINGLVEAAEFIDCEIKSDNKSYKAFVNSVLNTIHCMNVMDKEDGCMFNTEYVPSHFSGHEKSLLIDLDIPMGQQGASVMAA